MPPDVVCTAEGLTSTKARLITELQNSSHSTAAESYITSSENENICARQVNEFRSKFTKDYPTVKERTSFLQPLNEYNVAKFACTTLQPTLLPYTELYDLRQCAEYVARYVNYEPLDCNVLEHVVVSPTQTISWAVGDAFDVSFLLASLLIGAGYDAYVVLGKAPAYIRLKDQTHMTCALLKREGNNSDPSKPWSVEVVVKDDCSTRRQDGEVGIHCWVLVKPGNRELPNGPCYVESSTGILYPIDENAPYKEIWCVWNDKNYWINPASQPDAAVDFSSWLQVLSTYAPFSSWVNKLEIPQFPLRHPPLGRRCISLDRAKVEYFGDESDPQGLTTRVTQFEDNDQIVVIKCTELFLSNKRSDHLIERIRRPLEMSFEERYSIKNPLSISSRQEIGSRRTIEFHKKSRADGLIERVDDIGASISERFHDRSDSLLRRVIHLNRLPSNAKRPKHTEISCGPGLGFAEIIQIDEHYGEPDDKAALKESVAIRSYQLIEKRIVLTYHCRHEALRCHDTFDTEDTLKPDSKREELLKLEASSILAVKKTQDEMIEMREAAFRRDLRLTNSSVSRCVEDEVTTVIPQKYTRVQEPKESDFDYLSPYLAQLDNPNSPLTKEEATQIREACLKGMKLRLLERANIMQSRLDAAREQLTRKQEAFQNKRTGRTLDEQAAFERVVTEETFKIKVMEKRLSEHEDSAITKYKALETKLDQDDRLVILRSEFESTRLSRLTHRSRVSVRTNSRDHNFTTLI